LAAIQGDVTQSATKLATLQAGQEQAGSRLAAIQGDAAQSALKLASLLAGQDQASTQLGSIRDNQTQSASNLGRIEAKQDQANTQLSVIRGEVTQAGAKMEALHVRQEQAGTELKAVHGKLDKVDEKQATTNAKLDRLTWAIRARTALIGIGLVAVVVLLWQQGSLAALATGRLSLVVHLNLTPGLLEDALRRERSMPNDESATYGHIASPPADLGKAPEEKWVPNYLLTEQAGPPCPSPEVEMSGGCWLELAKKPPCTPYYRKGDRCYSPAIGRRQKPMSDPASAPGAAPH
jgi:hypothetical protein